MTSTPTAIDILKALKARTNVLVSGPPSCGKTRLIQEVADAFQAAPASSAPPLRPTMAPQGGVAIPARLPVANGDTADERPSPDRTGRHIERIAFAANTRARDFTTAFVPSVDGGLAFKVGKGALIRANQAALEGKASLLVIDELNRGPAVQLFGDAIVAMEPDKRLLADDRPGPNSWPLHILDDKGQSVEMYLSPHLYILASMNQADVSVEPLDVAFLRRFEPIGLVPDSERPRAILGAAGAAAVLPHVPVTPGEVVEAAIRAWEFVNEQIELGRGPDYRIGHGVFLADPAPPLTLQAAQRRALGWWRQIATHVNEVFFGDLVGIGIAFRAGTDVAGYRIVETPYGQDQKQHLAAPELTEAATYALLRRVAGA